MTVTSESDSGTSQPEAGACHARPPGRRRLPPASAPGPYTYTAGPPGPGPAGLSGSDSQPAAATRAVTASDFKSVEPPALSGPRPAADSARGRCRTEAGPASGGRRRDKPEFRLRLGIGTRWAATRTQNRTRTRHGASEPEAQSEPGPRSRRAVCGGPSPL